jgi:hypothetical protein
MVVPVAAVMVVVSVVSHFEPREADPSRIWRAGGSGAIQHPLTMPIIGFLLAPVFGRRDGEEPGG